MPEFRFDKFGVDWSADYELTDNGRKRLQMWREEGLESTKKHPVKLRNAAEATYLDWIEQGGSVSEIRQMLRDSISHIAVTREENFRLIDITFHNLIVLKLVAKVDTVTELPSAFKADFGQYE